MDIIQCLSNAREERIKATSVVNELEETIRKMAQEKTFKKYQFHKITRNKMEFELFDVKARYDTYFKLEKEISITLIYTVCSKLPKVKRERLDRFKAQFNENGYAESNYYFKFPIWEELDYKVDLDAVLNDRYSLAVD